MSAWTNGTYTHKGLALLAKLTQGTYLKITRAVAGTGYVDPNALANQTAVSGAKQELSFRTASYPETGTCKLPMFLTNKNTTAEYKIRQIGLYANDPNEGEILYFIAQSSDGTIVPSVNVMPDYSATWTFYFQYGQADEVSVTVDPSNAITKDMLEEVRILAEEGVSKKVTGVVVRHDNAAALPFAGLKVFGKTKQTGTPTIDSPVPLVNILNPTIAVLGKNLLPFATQTFEVMTSQALEAPLPAGDYWLSCTIESTDTDGDLSTIVFLNAGKNVLYLPLKRGSVSRKITLNQKVDKVQLCAAYNNSQGEGDTATWSNVQLERCEKFTGYEAYKEPQLLPLEYELCGVPVSSGGNYTDEEGQQWVCDEIDFARGVKVTRITHDTYDGSEVWAKSGTHSYYIRTPSSMGVQPICNRLGPRISEDTPYIRAGVTGDGVNAIIVSFGASAGISSAEEFKAMLAQYPLEVKYAIDNPTETALYHEASIGFAALRANKPTTTVTIEAGAWEAGARMEVDLIKAQNENAFLMVNSRAPIESAEHPGCYNRPAGFEVEWINPPMEAEVEYRTTERFQGKPVYIKQIVMDFVGSTTTQTAYIYGATNVWIDFSRRSALGDVWEDSLDATTLTATGPNTHSLTVTSNNSATVITQIKYTK